MQIQGTNVQAKMNHLRVLKNTELRRKHSTYNRLALSYNDTFSPNPFLPTPSLVDVERMDIGDPFFDCGSLSHPKEPWAIDPVTQDGIEAYLDLQRCEEELRRIAKEVRQMMNWGLEFQAKIDKLRDKNAQGMDISFETAGVLQEKF